MRRGCSWARAFTLSRSRCSREPPRIVSGSGDDTLRTKIFDIALGGEWPQEYTGRVLPNSFSEKWRGREAALATDSGELALYAKARAADDFGHPVIHAGEGIDLLHAIEPACAIVARRWRG